MHQMFEGIVEPLLYTNIICENLPLLMDANVANRAQARRRFACTKSLDLEYCTKGDSQEISYSLL